MNKAYDLWSILCHSNPKEVMCHLQFWWWIKWRYGGIHPPNMQWWKLLGGNVWCQHPLEAGIIWNWSSLILILMVWKANFHHVWIMSWEQLLIMEIWEDQGGAKYFYNEMQEHEELKEEVDQQTKNCICFVQHLVIFKRCVHFWYDEGLKKRSVNECDDHDEDMKLALWQ